MGNIRETSRASLIRCRESLSVEDIIPMFLKLRINMPSKVRVARLFITMVI